MTPEVRAALMLAGTVLGALALMLQNTEGQEQSK